MNRATMMKTLIFVQLLNEGTVAYRPVYAHEVEKNIFKIDGTVEYDSEDEEWEFKPGSYVVTEQRVLSGGEVLVAVREDNR